MQHLPATQDAPPIVGVIDPDPVARSGLRTLLHGLGIDVSNFDSAESYLLAANGRHLKGLLVDQISGEQFVTKREPADEGVQP